MLLALALVAWSGSLYALITSAWWVMRILGVAAGLIRITADHFATVNESGLVDHICHARHVLCMLTARRRHGSIPDALRRCHLLRLWLLTTLLLVYYAFLTVGLAVELGESHQLVVVWSRNFGHLMTLLPQTVASQLTA